MKKNLEYILDANNCNKTLYDIRCKMFYGRSQGVYYNGGYNINTNQITFSICFNKNTNEFIKNKTKDNLLILVKKLLPQNENNIYFKIFESTCSEHGVYNLVYNKKENKWFIQITKYNTTTIIKYELIKLLDYIKNNLSFY